MKKKCFIFLMVLLFGFSFDTEAGASQKEEWQNELSLEQADLSLQENTEQSFSLQQYVTDVMDGTADFSSGMHRKKLFYIFLHSVCLRGFL